MPSGSAWNQTFYAFDWRGNTINRLDGNGNLQTTSTYNAYNNRISNLNDVDPYDGFGGQYGYYKDTEAGPWFYLLGERYYQPDLGRFLTRDPIGQAGGINVYSYADNNPINNVDPSGLDTFVFNGTVLKRYSSNGPTAGQLIGSWPAASGFPGTGRADQTIYHRGPLPEGTYHFNIADVQQYSPSSLDKINGFVFSSGRFFDEGHSGWGD